MKFKKRDQASIRSYSRISLQKRKRLVSLVLEKGLILSKAVRKLKIKLTTARLILKKYKDTGAFRKRSVANAKKDPEVKIQQPQDQQQAENMPLEETPQQLQNIKKQQQNLPNQHQQAPAIYNYWPFCLYYQWQTELSSINLPQLIYSLQLYFIIYRFHMSQSPLRIWTNNCCLQSSCLTTSTCTSCIALILTQQTLIAYKSLFRSIGSYSSYPSSETMSTILLNLSQRKPLRSKTLNTAKLHLHQSRITQSQQNAQKHITVS